MEMIKNLLIRLFAKKVKNEVGVEKWEASKTKLTAIVAVLITAIQVLGPAFGHPVTIPEDVYKVLGALGLWALKDGQGK